MHFLGNGLGFGNSTRTPGGDKLLPYATFSPLENPGHLPTVIGHNVIDTVLWARGAGWDRPTPAAAAALKGFPGRRVQVIQCFGAVSQPGNGPTSNFQPVSEPSSGTTRRLVKVLSRSTNSSRGRVWSAAAAKSGTGYSQMLPSS